MLRRAVRTVDRGLSACHHCARGSAHPDPLGRPAAVNPDDAWVGFDEEGCMGWNEDGGAVSGAFNEWSFVDQDIRAFLSLSTRWATRLYDETWKQAEGEFSAIFDPDRHTGDEHVGLFASEVEGLWPNDYAWMLRAAVVRDAVTAFEVYLEKGLDEAFNRRGLAITRKEGRPSPPWRVLVKGHKVLGNDVDTGRIKQIRYLRHLLSHQRGELRTEKMRVRFAQHHLLAASLDPQLEDGEYLGSKVQLAEATVEGVLDGLAAGVREADKRVWAIAWGGAPAPELDKIRARFAGPPDGHQDG